MYKVSFNCLDSVIAMISLKALNDTYKHNTSKYGTQCQGPVIRLLLAHSVPKTDFRVPLVIVVAVA